MHGIPAKFIHIKKVFEGKIIVQFFVVAKCIVGKHFRNDWKYFGYQRENCPSGKDVCVEIKEETGLSHSSCESSRTLIDKIGLSSEGCITVSSIKYCACTGDYCSIDTSGKNLEIPLIKNII